MSLTTSPFIPVMVRPAHGTMLSAATPVPVCRTTGALTLATLKTFFPAATGLLYNLGQGMQVVSAVTSPDGEAMFLLPDFNLHYVATFGSEQCFVASNSGDSLPALTLENQRVKSKAFSADEPQLEDVTRTQGNLNMRLGKIEKEMVAERKKVSELWQEKEKLPILKKKVGEIMLSMNKLDGIEEVGRQLRDVRELRRELVTIEERLDGVEKAVQANSEASATTRVLLTDIAGLAEDLTVVKEKIGDQGAVSAEVVSMKEEMGEIINSTDKSKSQVDQLEEAMKQMEFEILKLKELVQESNTKDPNHNIPSGNDVDSLDQEGSDEFANNDVSPEMKLKEDAKEGEAQVVKEVQSKETSVLMKNQIHAEKDQAVVKKGKRGDYVDVEEEEEEKAIAPPTLVSMKPKLTKKNSQRK